MAVVLAALGAGACAGGPGPSENAPGMPWLCPAPLDRSDGRTVPRRIRLANETTDTLDVWLDRCFRHTRLGTVPPGGVLQPRLPERLVAFPEGLRLHAQRLRGGSEFFGSFVVPVRPVPVLEAVLVESARVPASALQPIELGAESRLAPVTVPDDDGGGSTSVFAVDGGAVLSWACDPGSDPALSLSLPDPVARPAVPVGLGVDGVPLADPEPWSRLAGPGGAVLRAPQEVAARFTRAARGGSEARVAVGPPASDGEASPTVLRFPLAGLARELDGLGCSP